MHTLTAPRLLGERMAGLALGYCMMASCVHAYTLAIMALIGTLYVLAVICCIPVRAEGRHALRASFTFGPQGAKNYSRCLHRAVVVSVTASRCNDPN